jgi:hypothetical protein
MTTNFGNTIITIFKTGENMLKFEIVAVASMKMTVSWDVAPCSLVETDRRFRDVYCLHLPSDE